MNLRLPLLYCCAAALTLAGALPLACTEDGPASASGTGADASADAPAEDSSDVGPMDAGHDAEDGALCLSSTKGVLPPIVGGARIRPVYVTSADGLDAPYTLRDTQLDLDCEVHRLTDGEIRCVPPTAPNDVEFRFTDSSCSTRVLFSPRPISNPVVILPNLNAVCEGDRIAVSVGPAISPAPYARDPYGICRPVTDTGGYTYSAALTASLLANFQSTRAAFTPDLDLAVYVGDDGARAVYGELWQSKLGTRLYPPAVAGRWMPVADGRWLRSTPFPTDGGRPTSAECRGDFFVPSACREPNDALILDLDGALFRSEPAFLQTAYRCVDTRAGFEAFDASASGFLAGESLPICAVPIGQRGKVGGSRLQIARVSVNGVVLDGVLLETGQRLIHDSATNANCTPRLADDGTIRCLPTTSQRLMYLDAACSQPVALGPSYTPGATFASDISPLGHSGECGTSTVYDIVGTPGAAPLPADLWRKAKGSTGSCECRKVLSLPSSLSSVALRPAAFFQPVAIEVR